MKIHNELLVLRQKEKQVTSEILEKLQQMEDAKGHIKMGYSSLFDYLVRGLNYSEATAYQRQACVRLTRQVPEIKQKIDQGRLSLSSVAAAYKHMRKKPLPEKRKIIQKIENKSAREVKKLFAEPIKTFNVKKTEYKDKVLIRLELSLEQNEKLQRLKSLKSHRHNLESLFEDLVDKELKSYENTSFRTSTSKNPRQISKRLRNHVLKKSNYKCQYPGCNSRDFLQVDHIIPVRSGGDQRPFNLQVLCAAHNKLKN